MMSHSLSDIFAADARKYITSLRSGLEAEGGPYPDVIRRAARRLHHSAALASYEPVMHASAALQKMSVQLIAGKRRWSREMGEAMEMVLSALEAVLADMPRRNPEHEARLHSAAERLVNPSASRVSPPVAEEAPAGEAEAVLAAIISDLGEAVERLENDPRDREPLKAMLRKIRRLRELGRIESLSPQDKALGAVEELILQIADLNATVGPGYLNVFSRARELLEEMRAQGESAPSLTIVGGHAVEVDRLKEQVIERARRARQVVWVSEIFYPRGPHIVSCPLATAQGGLERYFLNEATQRLEKSETLRRTMLESNAEQMRLAGESLSHTLRHLRERAAAFDHGDMGRVTRRAAAALRAQLVRPPARLQKMAENFGDVFAALRAYLASDDRAERGRAIQAADEALHIAILGGEPDAVVQEDEFDPDEALRQALSLRTRVDERLRRLSGPDADALRQDLEELFGLVSRYLTAPGRSG
ncbi:MAG: hypothetical protein PVI01_07100 [Gemmatimonadales bacterium]|jgi:hypothetical protein